MKVKQFVRISILAIAVFAILANLGLLQLLACNMTAPKLPLDETFSWRNGKYERIFYGESDAQFIDLYVPKGVLFPRLCTAEVLFQTMRSPDRRSLCTAISVITAMPARV